MGIIIAIISVVITLAGFSYKLYTDYKKKKRIPEFEGRIGVDENDGKQTQKFIDFIFNNENKIIYIDIYFDNNEDYKLDKDGIFYFSIYYDKNNKFNGGYEFRIEVKNGDDFFYDSRHTSKRLKGYLKIIGYSGPQMGWMTALMKPVNIDTVENLG